MFFTNRSISGYWSSLAEKCVCLRKRTLNKTLAAAIIYAVLFLKVRQPSQGPTFGIKGT